MFSKFDLGVVIPVRLGSSRVAQKALLPVGAEGISLLAWKIRQLKKVLPAENIYVSSEAKELLSIANDEGVVAIMRCEYLADGHKASFSEVITGVVKSIPHDHIAWVTCVVPLMTPQEYLKGFNDYYDHVIPERSKFDSLVSVNLLKEYLWDERGPINYQANKDHTISQELPDIFRVTNGLYMAPRSQILKQEYLLGDMPYKLCVSKISGIDIDEYDDYEIARDLIGVYDLQQKNHYSEKVVFLDFDGVIADSALEAYAVAVLTINPEKTINEIDFNSEHCHRFLAQRYNIGPAWNYYYLLSCLENNQEEKFDQVLPGEPGKEAKLFQQRFFATRAAIRNNFWADWMKLTSCYEWADKIIDLINNYSNIVILTTKDSETVHLLLKNFGVKRSIDVFGNKEYEKFGCKSIFIDEYIKKNKIKKALFIDDSMKHIKKCGWVENLEVIQARWGYVSQDDYEENVEEVVEKIYSTLEQ